MLGIRGWGEKERGGDAVFLWDGKTIIIAHPNKKRVGLFYSKGGRKRVSSRLDSPHRFSARRGKKKKGKKGESVE